MYPKNGQAIKLGIIWKMDPKNAKVEQTINNKMDPKNAKDIICLMHLDFHVKSHKDERTECQTVQHPPGNCPMLKSSMSKFVSCCTLGVLKLFI